MYVTILDSPWKSLSFPALVSMEINDIHVKICLWLSIIIFSNNGVGSETRAASLKPNVVLT
jgi:hypothetical protein